MKYYKKLEGKKCYLSPINLDDAEQYVEWLSDLEVTFNLAMAAFVINLKKEEEILESLSKEKANFAIIDSKKDRLIGNCGLLNINQQHQRAEVGIFIGNKKYWGKGFGTEALMLLCDYAFNLFNLNSLMLRVYSFNKRAIACYEKCGFQKIGKRREAVIINGKKYDEVLMDLLAKDFESPVLKEKFETEILKKKW